MDTDVPSGSDQGLPIEFRILSLFASANLVTIGPTDVQRLLAISKGSVSPKLKALADAGYLQPAGNGRYEAGPAMASMFTGYLKTLVKNIDQAQQAMALKLAPVRALLADLAQMGAQTGAGQ